MKRPNFFSTIAEAFARRRQRIREAAAEIRVTLSATGTLGALRMAFLLTVLLCAAVIGGMLTFRYVADIAGWTAWLAGVVAVFGALGAVRVIGSTLPSLTERAGS